MVPCLLKRQSNTYDPLTQPFGRDINWRKLQCRQSWLPNEDDALNATVHQMGPKAWALVAREVNRRVHHGLPVRQGKQCRERYYNHIDPRLVKGNWTEDEDSFILSQQNMLGNRWSDIAKVLQGRTENQIKNRFKSLWKRTGNAQAEQEPFSVISNQVHELSSSELVEPSPSPSPSVLLFFNPFN